MARIRFAYYITVACLLLLLGSPICAIKISNIKTNESLLSYTASLDRVQWPSFFVLLVGSLGAQAFAYYMELLPFRSDYMLYIFGGSWTVLCVNTWLHLESAYRHSANYMFFVSFALLLHGMTGFQSRIYFTQNYLTAVEPRLVIDIYERQQRDSIAANVYDIFSTDDPYETFLDYFAMSRKANLKNCPVYFSIGIVKPLVRAFVRGIDEGKFDAIFDYQQMQVIYEGFCDVQKCHYSIRTFEKDFRRLDSPMYKLLLQKMVDAGVLPRAALDD